MHLIITSLYITGAIALLLVSVICLLVVIGVIRAIIIGTCMNDLKHSKPKIILVGTTYSLLFIFFTILSGLGALKLLLFAFV